MAATAAEDAADDDASFELVEVCSLSTLRRSRVAMHMRPHLASGHLVIDARGRVRRARIRLAIRSGPRWIHYLAMRRGSQTVRLPFA